MRYISFNGAEIVRGIYVAVRDRYEGEDRKMQWNDADVMKKRFWNTLPSTIQNLRAEESRDKLFITYDAVHTENNVDIFIFK